MIKQKLVKETMLCFWLFLGGSFFGYLFETMVVIIQGSYELRTGLIYGKLIPVYGIGLMTYYLVLSIMKKREEKNIKQIIFIFIITAILGGMVEYISSFVQEKCLGSISWDYTYLKINFAGRTSLYHSCVWGILGVIYYIFIMPIISKASKIFENKKMYLITIVCSIVIFTDIIISCLAVHRQYERRLNIEANGYIDTILDKKYPDEFLKQIYPNMKMK